MFVQENFDRWAPLSRSPNTHRSFLNLLNLPKCRLTVQHLDLFGWLCMAHLKVSFHM